MADDADDEVHFDMMYPYSHHMTSSSMSSLVEATHRSDSDPFDFSAYMDQVCLVTHLLFVLYNATLPGALDDADKLSPGDAPPILCQAGGSIRCHHRC